MTASPPNQNGPAIAGRLPDFVIIGSPKCGTTTLRSYLVRHPSVFMCTPEEPQFFGRDTQYAKGIDWYRSLFSEALPDQVCGEGSPVYSRWPHCGDVAARMSTAIPDAKLIYIVRNPVDRAYSDYVQRVKIAQNVSKPADPALPQLSPEEIEAIEAIQSALGRGDYDGARFEDIIKITGRVLDTGLYMDQIEHYLRYYDKSCLLVLFFDDLLDSPADVCRAMFSHLGINPEIDVVREDPVIANSSRDHHQRHALAARRDKIQSNRVLNRISSGLPSPFRRLGRRVIDFHSRCTTDLSGPPRMLPETRDQLVEFYREPNARLAEFVGRDLTAWNG